MSAVTSQPSCALRSPCHPRRPGRLVEAELSSRPGRLFRGPSHDGSWRVTAEAVWAAPFCLDPGRPARMLCGVATWGAAHPPAPLRHAPAGGGEPRGTPNQTQSRGSKGSAPTAGPEGSAPSQRGPRASSVSRRLHRHLTSFGVEAPGPAQLECAPSNTGKAWLSGGKQTRSPTKREQHVGHG